MKETVISKDFPKKLKRLRLEKGWTQGQVSKRLGVDSQRVSKYERGVLSPTTETIIKIANLYNISLDYLIRDGQNGPTPSFQNQKLMDRIEKIANLSEENQNVLMAVMDAFIRQSKLEEIMQNP